MPSTPRRVVEWVGSSLDDIREMPEEVRRDFGQAIYEAEQGGKHPSAKPLTGSAFKGAAELEIVTDHDGDTFRAVYTLRLPGALYVLDAFQKKSTKGIKTPKHIIDRILRRLDAAKEHHAMHYAKREAG